MSLLLVNILKICLWHTNLIEHSIEAPNQRFSLLAVVFNNNTLY